MGQHVKALQQQLTGTGLAVLLHVVAVVWWLSMHGSITPPSTPVQTMNVSLLSSEQPAPPTPTPPSKAALPTPQKTVATPPRQLAVAAKTDVPAAETVPAASATSNLAAAAPAASTGAPSEVAAVVPPRFDAAYLANPAPPYPGMSRKLNEQGRVLLRVKVSAEGLPTEVDIAQSSGFPRLDAAAREAVLGWKFVPARQGDKPIAAAVNVPIVFKLN